MKATRNEEKKHPKIADQGPNWVGKGSVLFEGKSEEVKKNEKVVESYLGKSTISKEK